MYILRYEGNSELLKSGNIHLEISESIYELSFGLQCITVEFKGSNEYTFISVKACRPVLYNNDNFTFLLTYLQFCFQFAIGMLVHTCNL